MERKNTVLLTVIAVATLLVAVVGATFAYFTASNSTSGSTEGTTATTKPELDSVTLTKTNGTNSTENELYPGRMIYVGSTIGATVKGNGSYTVKYKISAKVTLSEAFTKGDVKYYLYRTTESVAKPVDCGSGVQTAPGKDGVHYYVTCTKDSETFATGDTVSGNLVATGTISANAEETTKEIPLNSETVDTGSTNYYYLVVEYVNKPDEDQSADKTKTITAEILDATITETSVKA